MEGFGSCENGVQRKLGEHLTMMAKRSGTDWRSSYQIALVVGSEVQGERNFEVSMKSDQSTSTQFSSHDSNIKEPLLGLTSR